MKNLISAVVMVFSASAFAEYVPNPYRSCQTDSYVTFKMQPCQANQLAGSAVTQVCMGSATAFEITYPVIQLMTKLADGQERVECLFTNERRPHKTQKTARCDRLATRYYTSAYAKLPRTEISECWVENKAEPVLIGASTDGSLFEVGN